MVHCKKLDYTLGTVHRSNFWRKLFEFENWERFCLQLEEWGSELKLDQ